MMRVAVVLICLVGCGGSKRQQILGKINFRGEPLAYGRIQFFTLGKPPLAAGGALIKDGQYAMPAELGLDPGTYRIQLDSMEPDPTYKPRPGEMLSVPPSRNRLPDRYYEKSTITVEVVPNGVNRFDFDIEEK